MTKAAKITTPSAAAVMSSGVRVRASVANIGSRP